MHTQATANTPPQHPLDPLSAQEYLSVQKILNKAGHIDADSRYPLITLEEPHKTSVLKWQRGDTVPRRAFVIVKKGRQTFEAVVDITHGTVTTWTEIQDVEPGMLLTEEWLTAQEMIRADSRWQAAMRKRGFDNFQDIACIPHTVGYHGLASEAGRRLVKMSCYDSRNTPNFWGRPIEGLIAVLDHHTKKIVELIDTGVVPIPTARVDFAGPATEKNPKTTAQKKHQQTIQQNIQIEGSRNNRPLWESVLPPLPLAGEDGGEGG